MITPDRYLAILAESDSAVQQAAQAAFARLLEKIRAGESPRAALDAVLKEFNAGAIEGFREALNAILESSLGTKEVKAYQVGKVKLSDALYANAQAVASTSQQIIEKHLQGLHDARELRKALYEGYDFQDDPLKVVKPLPKYLQVEFDKFKAAALKTPALRAAYLEAIRQKEAGAGMDALEKALRVAFYERNRYFANRIARTELHRNHMNRAAKEIMEEEQIEYVEYYMSRTHPFPDQCDAMAKVDRYGLGPGIFPKALAPKPPLHPHCRCVCNPRLDVFPKHPPKEREGAERAFLASLPAPEAARVAGSYEKRRRVLDGGETLEAIYNEGQDELYKWKRLGDMTEKPQVKAARLSSKAVDAALAEEENLVIPARVRPVSQAFDFPDEPEYAPIRRALAAIDAAHDDGDLPSLPIELARDLAEGNDGEYWGDDAHAFKIRIAALSRSKEFSLACEVGHFLDHQALAPGQGYATLDPQGALLDVLLSIQLSKSAQSIQSYAHDAKAYNYLNDETEWWSRAYAQWVALRSGSAILKKQADHAIHGEVGFWEWEDFDPIAKAIDQLFRQKGWL